MIHRVLAVLKHVANTPKALIITMLTVFTGCSAAYMVLEDKGPVESMWWALVTASTVGYGDQYPETSPGRAVGGILIFSFVWLLIFAGAQITANLIADPDCFSDSEQEELKQDVKKILALLDGGETVRHQIIINSISDLSNDELRKIIDAEKKISRL